VEAINSSILDLESRYANSLKPILLSHGGVHERFLIAKSEFIAGLEKRIVAGLQECVNVAATETRNAFKDYSPKKEFLQKDASAPERTKAAREIHKFLGTLIAHSEPYLEGNNRLAFFTVLGLKLLDTICELLLGFKYTHTGALVFVMDASEYEEVFSELDVDAVRARLEDLRHAGNILQASRDSLTAVFEAAKFSSPDSREFTRKLLALRVDAKEINLVDLFGPEPRKQ
jgi:hypothetical protein